MHRKMPEDTIIAYIIVAGAHARPYGRIVT